MGGSKPKAAAKPEGYDEREAEILRLNLDNERQMRTMMYYGGRDAAQMAAQQKELGIVNEQMTQAMVDAQKTISGFDSQERRRLFEAKKGSGQVGAEDTAITQDMYDAAKKTISGGSGAWDTARKQAKMRAGEGGWTKDTGTLEDYINRGLYATQEREKAIGGQTNTSSNKLGSSTFGNQNDKRWNDTGL